MSILNSLPKKIGIATEDSNGLMTFEDKKAINKINRIEADVANKMNRDEKIKSSQLDTSSNAAKIQVNNLSDEVKSMMTGKTPVSTHIENNSLITDYYANNSVTFNKRTAVGSVAVIASDDYCNFDTTKDEYAELSIPGDYSIYFGNKVKNVTNTPETLEIQKGIPSVITYNELEGFGVYTEEAVKEQDFIIGVFDGQNVSMFNGRYTINNYYVITDDSLNGSSIKDFTLDSLKIAIQHGIIISDSTNGSYINVNFTSKFIEVVKEFNVNIADQFAIKIKNHESCIIPDNINTAEFLYIYYDLGNNKLKAVWALNILEKDALAEKKLVLLSIVSNSKKIAVGNNKEFISINSNSIKNININYIDLYTGIICIDFKQKKIISNNVSAFVNNTLIELTEGDTQTINITDDSITNITSSKIPYTLAAVRVDFDTDKYRLIFDKTENIRQAGLDILPIASIKNYTVSNNKDFITVYNSDGNMIKSNNIISTGYITPIDNETIVCELSTMTEEGNLILTSTIVPGCSIIDSTTNIQYSINTSAKYQTVIRNLHGLYGVLFNIETKAMEIVSVSEIIDRKSIYISLGFVNGLFDSELYTATGNICNHITLNAQRPSNYAIITGPDPDKGYDWSNNRLVLPEDIYLLTNTQYSIYCQNMSMNRYIDNDYIGYEIALPNESIMTENNFTMNVPVEGSFKSLIAGKFKGNNSNLFKDVNLHFTKPKGKELTVLCIGDDTVDMNMPSYIKRYLSAYDYDVTMLGTVKNVNKTNGYGLDNLETEYGEGHKGWRMTDFMCSTKYSNNSPYYMQGNPFMNNSKFNFTHYMQSNNYEKVDVVVISVGMNDITGYHTASVVDNIKTLNIYENIELLPELYKQMITNIHEFDNNIKIIINPTMIKGIEDEFNKKSLMLSEVLFYDLKDIDNVFFVPGYLTQPLFTGINSSSIKDYNQSSGINNTKLGTTTSTLDINGMAQSNLSFMITSAIINATK